MEREVLFVNTEKLESCFENTQDTSFAEEISRCTGKNKNLAAETAVTEELSKPVKPEQTTNAPSVESSPGVLPRLPMNPNVSKADFFDWQRQNPYFGKRFSILGDSVSTLLGWNPPGYNVFYEGENCISAGVHDKEDTWWGKVIDFFGGQLLVNGSWSGSRVTDVTQAWQTAAGPAFPAGCSDGRIHDLHRGKEFPDVIIVDMGGNDWANGVKSGLETKTLIDTQQFFDDAYRLMLEKLQNYYPESEIWCRSMCRTHMSKCPGMRFPEAPFGTKMDDYNTVIQACVSRRKNCRYIDVFDDKQGYDTMDGAHPTLGGMDTIAQWYIGKINQEAADRFLNLRSGTGRTVNAPILGNTQFTPAARAGEGATLAHILETQGRQPVERVVDWGKQLCDVLGYLHDQDPPRIYRGLQPETIGLTSDGHIKLLDFSMMVLGNQPQNRKNGRYIMGSPGYAAPEQYGGYMPATARTDIYSLGATLYRLVTGCDPDPSVPPLYGMVPICQLDPTLPKRLEKIILRCTQMNAAERYASCQEVRRDLDKVLGKRSWFTIHGKKTTTRRI
jgi:hypothetical protein